MPRHNLSLLVVLGVLTALAVCAGLAFVANTADAAVSVTTSARSPANESTDVALTPALSVTIVVNNAATTDIQWYKQVGATWVLVYTTTGAGNGTHTITASWASSFDTTYNWRVVYKFSGGNSGVVYNFATKSPLINATTKSDILSLVVWAVTIAIIISVLMMVLMTLKFRGGR